MYFLLRANPGIGIKENDGGGEFSYEIFDIL
jgi:hypothetical protein